MSCQTCMAFFLLQNTKQDILKTIFVHIIKVSGLQKEHWTLLPYNKLTKHMRQRRKKSKGFGTTWGWANYDNYFGFPIPLRDKINQARSLKCRPCSFLARICFHKQALNHLTDSSLSVSISIHSEFLHFSALSLSPSFLLCVMSPPFTKPHPS